MREVTIEYRFCWQAQPAVLDASNQNPFRIYEANECDAHQF